jgi:hypothetical protein
MAATCAAAIASESEIEPRPRRLRSPRKARAAHPPCRRRRDCPSPRPIHRSTTRAASANKSRAAPCTCGMARRLKASWTRRPALWRRISLPAKVARSAFADRAQRPADTRRPRAPRRRRSDLPRRFSNVMAAMTSAQSNRRCALPGQATAARPGRTGCSVDEAQALLGAEHQRRENQGVERFGGVRRSARATAPSPINGNAMCAMCVEVTHRSGGRHLRDAVMREQRSNRSTTTASPGEAERKIVDCGGNDGAHRAASSAGPPPRRGS